MALDVPRLLERFRNGPFVVAGTLTQESLTSPLADPEGWTVRDVLVHLADAELVRSIRIRLILAEDSPELFEFDQEGWRDRLQYGSRDQSIALRLYRECIEATHDTLSSIDPAAWERVGRRPDGPLSVTMLVERGINHALGHAEQLRGILAR